MKNNLIVFCSGRVPHTHHFYDNTTIIHNHPNYEVKIKYGQLSVDEMDSGLVIWVISWVSDVSFLIRNGKQALCGSSWSSTTLNSLHLSKNGFPSTLSLFNGAVERNWL